MVIHDAVRPLVTLRDASRPAWTRPGSMGRASSALPVVGHPQAGHRLPVCIEATLPRERVWLAQTPQAFRTGLIRTAHERARRGQLRRDRRRQPGRAAWGPRSASCPAAAATSRSRPPKTWPWPRRCWTSRAPRRRGRC
ncbi:MAG: 2-C-methyl-D-erythritol 4-phosphate cytidylyltransferase [Desulfobacterales bacterium]|nr:2-C-methyl-D-erythritol 4-phosphate cytidylyltransferase [Desulfobacterales bacterium]